MTPAEGFHPAEYIEEELKERGWSVHDLVFRMRRYESESDWGRECLAVEMYLTVREPGVLLDWKMAIGFGEAFGVSPQMFINLHEAWRQWKIGSGDAGEPSSV